MQQRDAGDGNVFCFFLTDDDLMKTCVPAGGGGTSRLAA